MLVNVFPLSFAVNDPEFNWNKKYVDPFSELYYALKKEKSSALVEPREATKGKDQRYESSLY